MSNEISASVLYTNLTKKNDILFNDNFFQDIIDDRAKKISFATFLSKLQNTPIQDLSNNWTNVWNLIINDNKLLFTFLNSIKFILLKNNNVNFDYIFAIPRKTKINDKKTITLQVGLQYQAQTEILTNLGYDFKIDYILEGDDFNKVVEINKDGEFIDSIKYTQNNIDLLTKAPKDLKTNLKPEDYMNNIANDIYVKLKFAVVWVLKKNEKPTYILISKNELFSSLNSSLIDNYKNELKNCYKNRNGLKTTLDIAVIHIIYKKLILKSNEDETELQEIEQIDRFKKEEGIVDEPNIDSDFLQNEDSLKN